MPRDQSAFVGTGCHEHGKGEPTADDDLLDVQDVDPGACERLEHRGGDPGTVGPGEGHEHGGGLGPPVGRAPRGQGGLRHVPRRYPPLFW